MGRAGLWLAGGICCGHVGDGNRTLHGKEPRSVLTGRVVAAGTSGAISTAGTFAALAGAGFVAVVTMLLGWSPRLASTLVIAGFAGALLDSLLGATVQSRRWCDSCQ